MHVLSCFVLLKSVLLISCVFWILANQHHASLYRPAGCPSTIVVYTKHVAVLFSKTTVKSFGGCTDLTVSSNSRGVVYFACLSGRSFVSPLAVRSLASEIALDLLRDHHIITIIYPLTARVVGALQMISQPVSFIFPCSPLPSGTWRTPGLSIP